MPVMSKKKPNVESWLDRINNPREGDHEILSADLHGYYWRDWRKALRAYLADPRDPYKAISFMELHPANQRLKWGSPENWFYFNVDWCFVKVDPETRRIETKKNPNWKKNKKGKHPHDPKRNTQTNVWVEWGPHFEHEWDTENTGPDGIGSHDPRVDTGGGTFEEAMVNLAHNIWKLYGDKARVSDDAKLSAKDRW